MKTLLLFFATALVAMAGGPPGVSIESSAAFRDSVKSATKILVYEGLPKVVEKALYEKESKRADVTTFRNFQFYTPGVEAKPAEELAALLGSPKTIEVWVGEKRCGGFHPDYCVTWESGASTFYALICFGCEELIYLQGDREIRYDLSVTGMQALKERLKKYDLKRPAEIRPPVPAGG